MSSCFPGSTSLLCSPVVCKYGRRYVVFVKFLCCIKKNLPKINKLKSLIKSDNAKNINEYMNA